VPLSSSAAPLDSKLSKAPRWQIVSPAPMKRFAGPIKVLRPNLKLCIGPVNLPYLCVPLEMNSVPIQSWSYGISQKYFLV
jgi:hypothetical protein